MSATLKLYAVVTGLGIATLCACDRPALPPEQELRHVVEQMLSAIEAHEAQTILRRVALEFTSADGLSYPDVEMTSAITAATCLEASGVQTRHVSGKSRNLVSTPSTRPASRPCASRRDMTSAADTGPNASVISPLVSHTRTTRSPRARWISMVPAAPLSSSG